ncbi:hypothetical protein HHL16_12055 [Pseudoflavitalea sp. G-6-1-2]|uniref:hypothetical protein n=1 Tax=Pseudoflavitalea sp. G-6-1-2 TaxID=2728841 RepID=UPI00146F581A|nr:hypothetical protein [Pseudoflavitalea sp. G-6-1-2]NML21614.1 hypothetical protein [Pseudoflavitalea sp. G-6-1-2]
MKLKINYAKIAGNQQHCLFLRVLATTYFPHADTRKEELQKTAKQKRRIGRKTDSTMRKMFHT